MHIFITGATGDAVHVWHRHVREQRRDIVAQLNGFDAVAGFENVIPGIFQDVRGGYPHEHLVLNDEDDGRLALARRLRPAPGLPVRPQSRVRSYSCS